MGSAFCEHGARERHPLEESGDMGPSFTLTVTGCVASGKSLDLFGLGFLYLQI